MAVQIMPTSEVFRVVEVIPTLDTLAYASADRCGSIMEFTGLLGPGKAGRVVISTIVDRDFQSSAQTLMLFSELPTIASADNAALSIADAEMGKCMAVITFTNAYTTCTTASINTVPILASQQIAPYIYSTNSAGTVWGLLRCGGSPTYTAAGLTIRLGVNLVAAF